MACVSVVIPVKNGGADLERCLSAIEQQVVDDVIEVLIVDSGSSDNSVQVARAHRAAVYEIPAHRFTHGASRNLGASHAHGDVLVFISQDAEPADDQWLARLVGPLRRDSSLAGVYGRQLPHPDATPPERYFLDFLYGPTPRHQSASRVEELSMDTTLFSNVNSAMPRSMWEAFPFAEDIVMSEDQEWSRRALLAGHDLQYEPLAAVRHSHNYSLVAAFRRFFDSGVSSDRAYMAGKRDSGRVLRRRAIEYARGEMRWLWTTGQRTWIPYTVVYETAKMFGLVLGANHQRLPIGLKRRFSALPQRMDVRYPRPR
jgi:rhamnosyltransferase